MSTTEPTQLEQMAQIAESFRDLVTARRLTVTINGRQYIRVEGWTALAEMMGRSVGTTDVHPVIYGEHRGWQASAEMRTACGTVIATASSVCMDDESRWAKAQGYAVCGMAQTRAVGRVVRQALGHLVEMAGYATTPAEEMPVTSEPETIAISQVHSLVHLAKACDLTPAQAGAIVMRVAGVAQSTDIPALALDGVERAFLAARSCAADAESGTPVIDAATGAA